MNNHEIAAVFEEIAEMLEIKGDNPFKIRAYRNAAAQLENLGEELETLVEEERLTEIEGIGKDLAQKITALFTKGKLEEYEKLKKSVPAGLLAMMQIPGLGAKKIKILYEELGIKSIEELKKACEGEKIVTIKGFAAKTVENILKGIQNLEAYGKRKYWWEAEAIALPLLEELCKLKFVDQAEVAGSFRRKLETVGDLDFLVSSSHPEKVMDWFTGHKNVISVQQKGPTKSSVRLQEGFQADLRVVPLESYPFALHYFTGSKEHNIKIRHRFLEQGLSLSEYGLSGKKVPKVRSEEDLFKALGLAYIPPELREDRGEIEAAAENRLPQLITYEDIRGVFHCHTTASDGHNTLAEMVKAVESLGWEYIGITDHSKSSTQANGLSEERLIEQVEQIRKLNASKKYRPFIFAGTECDILTDGRLDYADDILEELDFVIVSIHRGFKMEEKEMTKRIIKAIEHPSVTMLGHMTGRLLLKREPYALNSAKIIDAAIANGKVIELNAHPMRLDMDWRLWHHAKEKGLKCSINPDAHSVHDLLYVQAGVNIARKGWLEKEDVITTFTLSKVKKFLNY